MEKYSKTERPERRTELKFFIKDNKLIRRTVTEVIESRETVSMFIPRFFIQCNYVFIDHTHVDVNHTIKEGFRMYYGEVISGKILKKLLFDENGKIKEKLKVNLTKANLRPVITEARYINKKAVNKNIVPNREYRIVCYHDEKKDEFVFDYIKSSYFMFSKQLRLF